MAEMVEAVTEEVATEVAATGDVSILTFSLFFLKSCRGLNYSCDRGETIPKEIFMISVHLFNLSSN